MKDGAKQFRRPLVGGFNRYDVIRYITKLADERNQAIESCKDAISKHQELLDTIAELHKRNVDITRNQAAANMPSQETIETTAETLSQLEDAVTRLYNAIQASRGRPPADFVNAIKSVGNILPIIRKSRQKIDEIQVSIKGKIDTE